MRLPCIATSSKFFLGHSKCEQCMPEPVGPKSHQAMGGASKVASGIMK